MILAALLVLALLLMWSEGLLRRLQRCLPAAGALMLAFGARLLVFSRPASEAGASLLACGEYLCQRGGFFALAESPLPLSLPLQALLLIPAGLGLGPEAVRALLVFADVVTAWGLMRFAAVYTPSPSRRLAVFLGALLLPSGVLGGAGAASGACLWCLPLVLSAKAAAEGRPYPAALWFGLAAALDLRALCLAPLLLSFPRSARPGVLAAGVGAYLAAHFPAILAGRDPARTLPFYPSLAQRFQGNAFQGTPGLYCLPGIALHPLAGTAIFLVLAAALLWWLRRLSRPGSRRVRPGAAAFLAGAAGLLLPFLGPGSLLPAELFALVPACVSMVAVPAAACFVFSGVLSLSLLPLPLFWGAAALAAGLAVLLLHMIRSAYGKKPPAARR